MSSKRRFESVFNRCESKESNSVCSGPCGCSESINGHIGKGSNPLANRLPPEVLTRILPFRTFERTLVISTHICRHRRSAISSVSTLRTNIPCRDLDRVLMHLERSKDALIDVHATSPFSNFRVHYIPSCRIERTRLLRANLSRDVHSAVLKMNPLAHGRDFNGLYDRTAL